MHAWYFRQGSNHTHVIVGEVHRQYELPAHMALTGAGLTEGLGLGLGLVAGLGLGRGQLAGLQGHMSGSAEQRHKKVSYHA
jgi:hypothetical protein